MDGWVPDQAARGKSVALDGVGHARTPPEFMKAGDVLETEIGLLRNRIGN